MNKFQCDEKKIEPNINVLMSIRFLKLALSDVSVSCISNCFRKAGFEDNSIEYGLQHESDEDDDVLLAPYSQRFIRSFENIVTWYVLRQDPKMTLSTIFLALTRNQTAPIATMIKEN